MDTKRVQKKLIEAKAFNTKPSSNQDDPTNWKKI